MKIYIETDMKEMPKGCGECEYSKTIKRVEKEGKVVACGYVRALEITFSDKYLKSRPSWCPLREEIPLKIENRALSVYIDDKRRWKKYVLVEAEQEVQDENTN